MRSFFLLFALPVLLLAVELRAQPNLIREGFDYAPLSPLNWAESNDPGWLQEWNRATGDDVIMGLGNLPYASLAEEPGNHLRLDLLRVGPRYSRRFLTIRDEGQTLWLSVLMDFPAGSKSENVGRVGLTRSGTSVFSIGKKYGNERIGIAWPGVTGYNTDVPAAGLHWLVSKIKLGGDERPDSAWLWIDPDPLAEPQLQAADLAVPQPGLGALEVVSVDGLQVEADGTPPLRMAVDELRLGGSFAAVNPFATTQTEERYPGEASLRIFPNPAGAHLVLSTDWAQAQKVQIELFDLQGKRVRVWPAQTWPAGLFQKRLSLGGGLTPGVYLLRLSGSHVQTNRLVRIQ